MLQALAAAFGAPAAARIAGSASLASALAWAGAHDEGDGEAPGGDRPDHRVLTEAEMALLAVLCAHVIPATDTPGAAELGVPDFVDHQLHRAEPPKTTDEVRHALAALASRSRALHDEAFTALDETRQRSLLEDLEAERNGFGSGDKWPFKTLKNLIVFGYCTTKVGATQLLAWDPVPGGFQGSVPYDQVGKAWFS